MKRTIIQLSAALTVILLGAVAAGQIGLAFSTNPAIVGGDVEIHGRLLANGAQGAPDGYRAAIIVDPIPDTMYGVMSTSREAAILAFTESGRAVWAFASDGDGVLSTARGGRAVAAVARDAGGIAIHALNQSGGTALLVEGNIVKEFSAGNRITIYNDAGAVIGSFLFSFD